MIHVGDCFEMRSRLQVVEPNIYLDTSGKTHALIISDENGSSKRFPFNEHNQKEALEHARAALSKVRLNKNRHHQPTSERARTVVPNRNKEKQNIAAGIFYREEYTDDLPVRNVEIFVTTEPETKSGRVWMAFTKSSIRSDIVIAWATAVRAEFLSSGKPLSKSEIKSSFRYLLERYEHAELWQFLAREFGWWDDYKHHDLKGIIKLEHTQEEPIDGFEQRPPSGIRLFTRNSQIGLFIKLGNGKASSQVSLNLGKVSLKRHYEAVYNWIKVNAHRKPVSEKPLVIDNWERFKETLK